MPGGLTDLETAASTGVPSQRSAQWAVVLVSLGALWLLQSSTGYWDRFLEWDEAVYYSQVAQGQIPAGFGAQRSRLVALLVAPVGAWTDSVAAVRHYLLIVTTLGYGVLFLRLRHFGIWAQSGLGLFVVAAVPAFYASVVSPNLWVALLAGVIVTIVVVPVPRLDRALLAFTVGVLAFLRPIDGFYLTGTVMIVMMAMVGLRSWPRIIAVGSGAMVGVVVWLFDTLNRRGDFSQVVDELNDAVPLAFSFKGFAYLTALDGPLLARGITWVTLPALIPVGVLLGVAWIAGARQLSTARLSPQVGQLGRLGLAAGVAMSFHYLFLTVIGAPRFLLAAWLLVSVATAALASNKLQRVSPWAGPMLIAVVAVTQIGVIGSIADQQSIQADRSVALAMYLQTESAGAPCVVVPDLGAPQVMFASGCVVRSNVGDLAETAGPRAFVAKWGAPDPNIEVIEWSRVDGGADGHWSVGEILRPEA